MYSGKLSLKNRVVCVLSIQGGMLYNVYLTSSKSNLSETMSRGLCSFNNSRNSLGDIGSKKRIAIRNQICMAAASHTAGIQLPANIAPDIVVLVSAPDTDGVM